MLSHHAPQTHVAITTTHPPSQTRAGTPASSNLSAENLSSEPATLASIPAGSASEEFVQLILTKLGPIWQQHQVLSISSGQAFEIDDFKVRVGEIKQGYSGGAQMGRGAVCEIEWGGEDGEESDWETGECVIRAFWEGLGVKGARDCFGVAGLREGDGNVRQWIEILRIRS